MDPVDSGSRRKVDPMWVWFPCESGIVVEAAFNSVVVFFPSGDSAEKHTPFCRNRGMLDRTSIGAKRKNSFDVVEGVRFDPCAGGGDYERKKFPFDGEKVGWRIDKLRDVGKGGNGENVIEVQGNGEAEAKVLDISNPINVFPNRALPRIVVAMGADKKAKIASRGRKRDVAPLGGDVEDDALACVMGEAPNGDDVGFGNVESEVGGTFNDVEGVDKRWEGFPKICNHQGNVVGISGEDVGRGKSRAEIAEKAISGK